MVSIQSKGPRVVTVLCVMMLCFFVYEVNKTFQYSVDAAYENRLRDSGVFLWERTGSRSRLNRHNQNDTNVVEISSSLLKLGRGLVQRF